MITKLHLINGETITVNGQHHGIFTLYDKTHIKLPKRHWENHWYRIAHTQTGIILLDQAKYYDTTKTLLNNTQMRRITESLDPRKFPEPAMLDTLIRNNCNGAIPIADHIKEVIKKARLPHIKIHYPKVEEAINVTQLSLNF
jgi:hypothetical protein